MHRIQVTDLSQWLQKKNRKPLVIRGARQVGKSTLVREFARLNNLDLLEVNLERHPYLNDVFASNDPRIVLDAISDILHRPISLKKSQALMLLFIDEIQAAAAAIPCLRYFYEEYPDLPVVCAGSLLEFTLGDASYSMPVGRIEFMHLGPMTFHEYLMAKGEGYILDKLNSLTKPGNISEALHRNCMELLKQYLFIGGMPEAVKTSIELGIDRIPEVHAQIVETYQNDFVKYTKKSHLGKIQKVFRHLYLHPCQKMKYAHISPDENSRDLKYDLDLLFKAKIATPVYHSACSGIPLEVTKNDRVYKHIVLDVGLLNYVQKTSWQSIKAFSEAELLTNGQIAEQFIGQHLATLGPSYECPRLYYWLREGKSANAEVDFILERPPFIVAIEVKAGASGKIRSLHQWMRDIHYQKKKCIRLNFSAGSEELVSYKMPDGKIEYSLLTLPIYLVQNLWQFV